GNVTNPEGLGGFSKGISGNPGGRPHSLSAVQLRFRQLCNEAVDTVAQIMRGTGTPLQLAAAREVLDRAHGRPKQQVDLDIAMNKKLTDLSVEELRALEAKLAAAMTVTPALTFEQPPTLFEQGDLPIGSVTESEGANG